MAAREQSSSPEQPRDKRGQALQQYTLEDVAKHNQPDDAWIAIRGKVYNISKWMDKHPGGKVILTTMAGKDCTDPFICSHPKEVEKKLPYFLVGEVTGWKPTPLQEDFWRVMDKLEEEGKFTTRMSYYYGKLLWLVALLSTSVYILGFHRPCSWPLVTFGAALLGLFWQQLSFLGHDLGHNAVTHQRSVDSWFFLMGTAFLGVSGQWWKLSHNVHHVVTNSIESDPDIQHLPVFAITPAYFDNVYSTYHGRTFYFNRLSHFFVRHQHQLYYIVMAVARVNMYLQSFLCCFNQDTKVERRGLELCALVIYQCWFFALLSTLPSTSMKLLAFFVSHAVCGLVHVQITLSHFAMPAYHGVGFSGPEDDFFHTQILASMNVDCPRWLDWLHGGLQFQVEHHLLPRLPRHNLRYAMEKHIVPLCEKYGLKYQSYSFIEGNIRVFHALKATAEIAQHKTLKDC